MSTFFHGIRIIEDGYTAPPVVPPQPPPDITGLTLYISALVARQSVNPAEWVTTHMYVQLDDGPSVNFFDLNDVPTTYIETPFNNFAPDLRYHFMPGFKLDIMQSLGILPNFIHFYLSSHTNDINSTLQSSPWVAKDSKGPEFWPYNEPTFTSNLIDVTAARWTGGPTSNDPNRETFGKVCTIDVQKFIRNDPTCITPA